MQSVKKKDRIIPNNIGNIIIRDKESETCTSIDVANTGKRIAIKKETTKFRIQRPYNKNTVYVDCRNKSDAGNNRDKSNYLKIIQTISEQQTSKALHQATTVNSHNEH
jgi:hypothetical protein